MYRQYIPVVLSATSTINPLKFSGFSHINKDRYTNSYMFTHRFCDFTQSFGRMKGAK